MNDRPTRASFSAITTFENCPLSYKLHYLEGLKNEAGAAAQRGVRLHRACELFLKGEVPIEKLPIDFWKIKPILEEYRVCGAAAEEEWLIDHNWERQKLEDENTRFLAYVDIHYLLTPTRLAIRDLKTGQQGDFSDQLETYATLGFVLYPDVEEIEVACLYLEGMGPTLTYNRAIAPFLREKLQQRWEAVFSEKEFKPTPSPNACKYCSFSKLGLCDSPWGRK